MEIHRLRITEDIYLEVRTQKDLIIGTTLLKGNLREEASPWVRGVFERYLLGTRDPEGGLRIVLREGIPDYLWRVYETLRRVAPFGRTVTYSDLAALTGTHPRFVGYAMRVNPFPVIIPCHRVVSKKGLGGFSCGVEIKMALLRFEGADPFGKF